jgi:hypothetical protein
MNEKFAQGTPHAAIPGHFVDKLMTGGRFSRHLFDSWHDDRANLIWSRGFERPENEPVARFQ